MKLKRLSLRMENLELHTCNDHLLQSGDHTTMEIVSWFTNDANVSIAYWNKDKEGYYLQFVGNRPLGEDIDPIAFMRLAAFGQKELDDQWRYDDHIS